MSTLAVGTIKSISSAAPVFQNTSGTEKGQLAKAWLNFNGTGTAAIRDSFNISSITDNSTGDFTINITTAMANVNYSVTGGIGTTTGNNCFLFVLTEQNTAKSTTVFRINTLGSNTYILSTDPEHCFIAIHGD
tara:strand:+ start:170 stop:568 length:399 start_codon:yes stop_codon:yes gene_type:complete